MYDDNNPHSTEDQSTPCRIALRDELITLLDNVLDGYFACDANWRFVHLDAKSERILGIRRDEVLGKVYWEIVPATLGTTLEQEFRRVARGEARDFEFYYEPWNRWYHNRCFPLKEGGVAVYYQDITDRKQMEERLHESMADLAEAQRIARLGNWRLTTLTDEVRWSEELYRIFDVDQRSFVDTYESFFQRIHPDDRAHVRQVNSRARDNGESFAVEYRIVTQSGAEKNILEVGHAIKNEEGTVTSLFGVAQDITGQKAAEAALQQSRDLLDITQQIAKVGGWEWAVDRQTMVWTDETYRIHGIRPDKNNYDSRELIKCSLACYDPEDRPLIEAAFWRCVEKGEAYDLVFPFTATDGCRKWIRTVARPEFVNERIVRVQGNIMDITEQKRAEDALRLANERLELAQSAAGAGAWSFDLENGHIEWSPELFRLFGLDPGKDHAGLDTWRSILHPDDLQHQVGRLGRTIQGDTFYNEEFRIVLQDGTIRWINMRGKTMCDSAGKPLRMYGICIDVTERKQTEDALSGVLKRSEMLANFIRLSSQPFATGYPDGSIGIINPAFERLIGYTEEELKAADWVVLTPPEWREHEKLKLAELRRTGTSVTYEKEYFRKDGSRVPVELLVHLITDAEGKPEYYYAFLSDITERKKHERELQEARRAAEEANRAKSQFLANMSHEIRTPINGISGMAQLLEYTEIDDEQRECIDAIRTCSSSLLALVNDVLDLSKIESGKVELEKRDFSLRASISDVITTQITQIHNKGLSIHTDIRAGVPDNLAGDQLRLKQILLNLLSNAVKFTDSGGIRISVTASERHGEMVQLTLGVADTGIGISPEAMKKIFKPFTQAEVSTTRQYGGTGLGLSICTQLAELMGGRIWAESTERAGSTFYLQVPFLVNEADVERHDRRNYDKATPLWDGPPLTILVVEDMAINMMGMTRILRNHGHTVLQAFDGADALRKWEEGKIDFILMDIQMPVMNGIEATRSIREKEEETASHIPIIALTGRALQEERDEIMGQGFDGYIAKPVELALLFNEMRRCLPDSMLKTGMEGKSPPVATRIVEAHADKDRLKALLGEIEALLKSSNMAVIEEVSELEKIVPGSGPVKTLKEHVKKCHFDKALTCLSDINREFA